MQHTVGPWSAEGPDQFGDFNILSPSKTLAVAAVVSNLRASAEVAANASLVAAAPDMLAALKDIVKRNEIQHWFNLDMARAAIAKAEGA